MKSSVITGSYDLQALARAADQICSTVYSPVTHGCHMRENRPRLKHLLSLAQVQLEQRGVKRQLARQWIEDVLNVTQAPGFLDSHCQGLVIFLSES